MQMKQKYTGTQCGFIQHAYLFKKYRFATYCISRHSRKSVFTNIKKNKVIFLFSVEYRPAFLFSVVIFSVFCPNFLLHRGFSARCKQKNFSVQIFLFSAEYKLRIFFLFSAHFSVPLMSTNEIIFSTNQN